MRVIFTREDWLKTQNKRKKRLNGTFSSKRANLNAAAAYHFPLINNVCESILDGDGRLSLAKASSIIFLNKVYS